MQTIRKIKKIKNKKVIISIPDNFSDEEVEVIVLPVKKESNKNERLKKILLNRPTLSSIEIKQFLKCREWMNKWNLKKF